MENNYPWIFNLGDNLWKIYLNNDNALECQIIYEQNKDKYYKEKTIDVDVVSFTICIEDEAVHIIYINKKNEIKYCTKKEDKWFGKVLYNVEDGEFSVGYLKSMILNGNMHIFYLLTSQGSSNHGILKHCVWNGKQVKIYTVQHMILSDKVDRYYEVLVEDSSFIDVFFLSDRGNEISLNYCKYDGSWTAAERLYGLQGDSILFKVLYVNKGFEIINRTRDGIMYSLDHVHIEDNLSMKDNNIYTGEIKPIEPIVFYIKNTIYICWKEKNKIVFSSYNLGRWSNPDYLDKKFQNPVKIFNFLDSQNRFGTNKIYGMEEEDGVLIFPLEKITQSILESQKKKKNSALSIKKEDESIEEIREKFRNIFYENSVLKEKIDSFSIHMQKKKQITEEYKSRIAKIIDQKKRLEKNCKFFMEVKKNIQEELDRTKKQLENDKKIVKDIRYKLEEKDKISKEFKERLDSLTEENKKLREELEIERSHSIVKKLFRRKDSL